MIQPTAIKTNYDLLAQYQPNFRSSPRWPQFTKICEELAQSLCCGFSTGIPALLRYCHLCGERKWEMIFPVLSFNMQAGVCARTAWIKPICLNSDNQASHSKYKLRFENLRFSLCLESHLEAPKLTVDSWMSGIWIRWQDMVETNCSKYTAACHDVWTWTKSRHRDNVSLFHSLTWFFKTLVLLK